MTRETLRTISRCTGLTLLVLSVLAVAPGVMLGQGHTTGFDIDKDCPLTVTLGQSYTCTFSIRNLDTQHGVINLAVTDTFPQPGGTPMAVQCFQGMTAVTMLSAAGPGDTCIGTTPMHDAPATCPSNPQLINRLSVSGNDADTGQFMGLPVSSATDNGPLVLCPRDEFCRTPGFWGTHADADSEKACSQNITQAVLDAAGGFISICGEDLCNTLVDDASSAVEALCVRVRGQETRQLARQLTAARLNCIVSGENGGPCDGISVNAIFDACNTACAADSTTVMIGLDEVDCIDALDCFNNGGLFDNVSGVCSTGTCVVPMAVAGGSSTLGINGNGAILCGPETPCTEGECVPFEDNCHDAAFPGDLDLPNDLLPDTDPCFEKQGPAGSSDECKAAHKTACTVIPPNESMCMTASSCM